jgi:Cell wall-active antibiotics response 4TMS YvqF
MVAFGCLLLLGSFGVLHVGIESMWPLLLIIWGVWVIGRAFGRDDPWRMNFRGAVRRKFQDATGVETPQEFAERLKSKIHDNIKSNIEDNIKSKTGGQTPTDFAEGVKSKIEDNVRSNFENQTNSKSQSGWSPQRGNESIDSEFDYMAIFGGIKQRIAVKNFRGGRLMAICGGFEIDLTRAEIEGQSAVIDASALMGGGEIRVPDTWIIELRGVALLGGYTDETHQMISDSATAKRLIVRGIAALGGVVIKN